MTVCRKTDESILVDRVFRQGKPSNEAVFSHLTKLMHFGSAALALMINDWKILYSVSQTEYR